MEEIIDIASSIYVENCDGEFVGTISHRLNEASLYPFRWTNSACSLMLGGPEIILVRVNGKWYFTGEDYWYMD